MDSVKTMCLKYYPRYWDINRLVTLVEKGKLSEEEYNEVTGFVYPATESEV